MLQNKQFMWTDLILAIGKFFKWSFQLLPPIGDFMNWVFTIIGTVLLVGWTVVLIRLGDGEDKEYKPKDKFPFM